MMAAHSLVNYVPERGPDAGGRGQIGIRPAH
jgi:hypothetical protein